MQVYRAPLRDMQFVLHELFGAAAADEGLDAYSLDRAIEHDFATDVLSAAARFCQDVLLPLNATGDRDGCRLEGGVVSTPTGFRDAYRQLCDGGWLAIAAEPAHGGQDLPQRVVKLLEEMFHAANSAFATYAGLTRGAIVALETFGSEELKQRFLPSLIAGTCGGTMCLTEPQSGSDLGLIETRALPRDKALFGITGTKIFVSAGEHDLAENILHLVLARLPDAPPGAKGLSLFAVPKLLREPGCAPTRNGVLCVGLERKMGLHGSATCQIAFDDATGWLVGSPHGGLRAIFSMVNSKRLSVAHQGIGIAEAALQSAAAYARSRRQGRASGRDQQREQAADHIIAHPDIRKTLMRMRVDTEGCRALGSWIAHHLDRARDRSLDEASRQAAEEFCALMTPVAKALFTELGFETASRGLQVHGGHGFIRDHGVEQYVRDARVCMIYEGTNGIQALDLLGRKVLGSDGRLLARFSDPATSLIEKQRGSADGLLRKQAVAMADALARLEATTASIVATSRTDPEHAGAAATDYLRFFGFVALGHTWLRASAVAAVALAGRPATDAAFYEGKQIGAQFFFDRVLLETAGMEAAIRAGSASVMALHPDRF